MKITDNTTLWVKHGYIPDITYIGKEGIGASGHCHITIFNLKTEKLVYYTINNVEKGDGVSCLKGHRVFGVFAFAEACSNPRIFIMNFPQLEIIHIVPASPTGYMTMTFSDMSLLITLRNMPPFEITVMNWMSGEVIAANVGGIYEPNQLLMCSLGSPVYLAQLALNTNILHIWDILICGKKCVLTEHVVQVPNDDECAPFTSVLWTTEGALFVLDKLGAVYVMNTEHELEKVLKPHATGPFKTLFTWYRAGLTIFGPDQEIRHYKKTGNWVCDTQMTPPEPLSIMLAGKGDLLATITEKQNVLRIFPMKNNFQYLRQNQSCFNDFCIINPAGDYVAVLSFTNFLSVMEIDTGQMVGSYYLQAPALALSSNPEFPYVGVVFETGVLELVSIFHPTAPTTMASFFLTREKLTDIYFSESGRVLVAANLDLGQFFVIEGMPGSKMEILATVEVHRQIADFIIIPSKTCYRLFMIPVTSDETIAGNKIIRYCIIKNEEVNVKEYEFEGSKLYSNLIATNEGNRDRVFYALPYLSKIIHQIETKRGDDTARVIGRVNSGHQLRKIGFHLNKYSAITWSYDGFIFVRSPNFKENIGMALPHHRVYGGVKKAFVDPCHQYIISLGVDNVIVCTYLQAYPLDRDLRHKLTTRQASLSMAQIFTRRTLGLVPKAAYKNLPWIEIDKLNHKEAERIKCVAERQALIDQLAEIRRKLGILITENLDGPDNEKLDLLEFNLDTRWYEQKVERNDKLCKATALFLKDKIVAQNDIKNWIMGKFWDKMSVQSTEIRAIFENYSVPNFVLLPFDAEHEERLRMAEEQRKLEQSLTAGNNMFEPWMPLDENQLKKMMTNTETKLEKKASYAYLGDEEEETETSKDETDVAFDGADTRIFVELNKVSYAQQHLNSFLPTVLQAPISQEEANRLKEFFNKDFDVMMAQKVKDMRTILEKNARLRHIISELNYFSIEQIDLEIPDPEWQQDETPELIPQVQKNEVKVTPYISPSQQAILDAEAAEAERIRLLLLADDFKERALMKMMNGVLEVRWEDELRKEVPIPKCMTDKAPEQYNEDDLRAIRDYEEAVVALNNDRKKYKKLLKAEFGKTMNFVQETIQKFNSRLTELLIEKMKIESAVYQENLKINRARHNQKLRLQYSEQRGEFQKNINKNSMIMESLHSLVTSLHGSIHDCKAHIDNLQVKEKTLEKAFKRDFQDVSVLVQETAVKLYKKRPKMNIRSINSTVILNELAKCVLTAERTPMLTQECLDFLKSLENLDSNTGGQPQMAENLYRLLCKHRRYRIEYEIRVRAAHAELTEAEATISALNKALSLKKERNAKLIANLDNIYDSFLEYMHNLELQIVLPQGYVELHMTGELSDFDDALLINRSDIEEVNKLITKTGARKLKLMRKSMEYRQGIASMEWEHKKLRMQNQDLAEKLNDINAVRVTRELLSCLNDQHSKPTYYDEELEMLKKMYENRIKEQREIVMNLKKQINKLKTENRIIDKKISDINVDVCEYKLMKDFDLDTKERDIIKSRMANLLKRSKLVQLIQQNHNDILVLRTELELLRLRTYPTLKYRVS